MKVWKVVDESNRKRLSESPVTRCRILRIAFNSHVTDLTGTNPKGIKIDNLRQYGIRIYPQKNSFYGRDKRVHRKHQFLTKKLSKKILKLWFFPTIIFSHPPELVYSIKLICYKKLSKIILKFLKITWFELFFVLITVYG